MSNLNLKRPKDMTLKKMFFDVSYFAKECLPEIMYKETPWFHLEIYKNLEDERNKRLAVIAPRGHAKSTLASLIYPLYRTAFNLSNFIVLISESLDQTNSLLRDLRDQIEFNERFRYYFGDLSGESIGLKWTESDMITSNNVRLYGRGTRQRIRGAKFNGMRPDLIILDDIESELNTETPEQREKLKKWLNGSVLPAVRPDIGRVFFIGTIVHFDSYLADLKNDTEGKLGWKTLFFSATQPDGTVLWPEVYSKERLEEEKSRLEAQGQIDVYYREYENEAIPPGTGIATRSDIRVEELDYKWFPEEKCWGIKEDVSEEGSDKPEYKYVPMFTFLGIDPSLGKAGRDRSGVAVYGVSATGKQYLLEAKAMMLTPSTFIDTVFQLMDNWKCRSLTIETTAFQEVYSTYLYEEMRKRGNYFTINEKKPRTSKDQRLLSLAPLYKSNGITHAKNFEEYVLELISFPKGKHDDILDAVYYAREDSYRPAMEIFQDADKKNKTREKIYYNWAVM